MKDRWTKSVLPFDRFRRKIPENSVFKTLLPSQSNFRLKNHVYYLPIGNIHSVFPSPECIANNGYGFGIEFVRYSARIFAIRFLPPHWFASPLYNAFNLIFMQSLAFIYINATNWFITTRIHLLPFRILFRHDHYCLFSLFSGKSALTIQLIQNHFVDEYDPTVRIILSHIKHYCLSYLTWIVLIFFLFFCVFLQIEDSYRKQVVIGEYIRIYLTRYNFWTSNGIDESSHCKIATNGHLFHANITSILISSWQNSVYFVYLSIQDF